MIVMDHELKLAVGKTWTHINMPARNFGASRAHRLLGRERLLQSLLLFTEVIARGCRA